MAEPLVRPDDIERARSHGTTNREIHDPGLIAAAFCMGNRYVDGLATWAPQDTESDRLRGAAVAQNGYLGILKVLAAQAADSKAE